MVEKDTQQTNQPNDIEQNLPQGLQSVFESISKNRKPIVIGLTSVALVIALWTGITWYNAHALTQAQNQLGEILQNTTGEERITKLAELAESAPSSIAGAVYFELATLCLDEKKYEQAREYYGKLVDDVDGENRIVAELGRTKAMMFQGEAAQAVTTLKEIANTASDSMAVPVNRQLAVAAEQAGDIPTAIAALEKLQEIGSMNQQFVEYKLDQLKNK